MADVKWPAKAIADTKEDLLQPTQEYLRGIDLLRKEGDTVSGLNTPASVQVVQSGALSMSKWWTGIIAAGGIGGVWAVLQRRFDDLEALPQAAALIGVGAIIAAAVIAIAMIVRADVLGRASATEARLRARAEIVHGFLDTTADFQDGAHPRGPTGMDELKASIATLHKDLADLRSEMVTNRALMEAVEPDWFKPFEEMLRKEHEMLESIQKHVNNDHQD